MKKRISLFLCILCGILIVGCGKKTTGTETICYYVNLDGNMLVQETYLRQEEQGDVAIKELLLALKNPSDIGSVKPAIPKEVNIEECRHEKDRLEIVLSVEYLELGRSEQVLLRAAVVQTLAQLSDVQYVSFFVGEEPVVDSDGEPIGLMSASDFVQNTGTSLKTYQTADLKLYFANKEGTKLSVETRNDVRYNINTSVEKLVVEKLMSGSSSEKRSTTIPATVKLLGVSVKDGICYVNFDSAFLTDGYNQRPEIAVYSIVNSIVANGNATKVQILIDGANDKVFKGTVDLREPLSWKSGLLEE